MNNGMDIENHSFLPFLVLNGGGTILCVSDNPECCTEDNANWFLPGSTTALNTSSSPYSVVRSSTVPKSVALRRDSSGDGIHRDDDDGLYRCEIIDIGGSTKILYVWLDIDVEGKYTHTSLMCTCLSCANGIMQRITPCISDYTSNFVCELAIYLAS